MSLLNIDFFFVLTFQFFLTLFGALFFAFLLPFSYRVKSFSFVQFLLFFVLFFSVHVLFPFVSIFFLGFSGLALLSFCSFFCVLLHFRKTDLFDYLLVMLMAFLMSFLFFAQWWMSLFLMYLMLILLRIIVDRFSRSFQNQKRYFLHLSFQSFEMLGKLDHLILSFDLTVLKREVEKKGVFTMRLDYQTNALMQHLFFKKLCQLKGLSRVLKL